MLWLAGAVLRAVAAPSGPTNRPPSDAFALRPLEWIPPFAQPRLIPAHFPREWPAAAVEHLATGERNLWLVARPRFGTNAEPGAGRLWVYSPEFNRLQIVPGAISNNVVNGVFYQDRRVWLALDGGVAAVDAGTWAAEGYDAGRGVLASRLAGLAGAGGSVLAFGRNGTLFTLPAGADRFGRSEGAAPRSAEPWSHFAASGQWLLAGSGTNLATRNLRSAQWVPAGADLDRGSPALSAARLQCVAGDGDGGFWLGTDAGLHWLDCETGQVENRFAPRSLTVPGGLGVTVAPGYQLTAAAYRQARDRVLNGVRDRMRDRARRERSRREGRDLGNWVEPTSRLPGPVTALLRDQTWLWVACADVSVAGRSRVLLYHRPTRRWVGWFPLGLPVRSLAVDSRFLWVGLEDTSGRGLPVLVAVEKLPLIAVPQFRWVRESITPEDLGQRLAALSPKERALHAFFGDDPAKVAELLAPDGLARPDADAESLFLLAFSHDAIGLNQPDKLDQYVDLLQRNHPDSLFTELAVQVRPRRAVPASTEAAVERPVPPEEPDAILERRDLNGDGKLNAVELRLWQGPEADLGAYDLNADGFIDRDELARMKAR